MGWPGVGPVVVGGGDTSAGLAPSRDRAQEAGGFAGVGGAAPPSGRAGYFHKASSGAADRSSCRPTRGGPVWGAMGRQKVWRLTPTFPPGADTQMEGDPLALMLLSPSLPLPDGVPGDSRCASRMGTPEMHSGGPLVPARTLGRPPRAAAVWMLSYALPRICL